MTLPETTPALEAAGLQKDLCRTGIEPFAWVVAQSLAAAHPADPLLVRRAETDRPQTDTVVQEYARRVYLALFTAEPPVGAACLRALAQGADAYEPAADA